MNFLKRWLKGIHTCKISLYYHNCPKCGFIFENRQEYEQISGVLQKDLQCLRCRALFTHVKPDKNLELLLKKKKTCCGQGCRGCGSQKNAR